MLIGPLRRVKFLIMAPFILGLCFVINLMTWSGEWWVQWVALGLGIAWVINLFKLIRDVILLGGLAPREWLVPAGVGGLVVLAVAFFVWRAQEGLGSLFSVAIVGLLVWRRMRNRRQRLSRKFVAKAKRLREVRLVALDGMKLTAVVDRAVAHTYVRLNAILDSINSSMFFGEHFTLVVRDDLPPEEMRALLTGPGVLYVREEYPEAQARPA